MKNLQEADKHLENAISDFQKFVVASHEGFYKQDSEMANQIGGLLSTFRGKLKLWKAKEEKAKLPV